MERKILLIYDNLIHLVISDVSSNDQSLKNFYIINEIEITLTKIIKFILFV